MGRSRPNPAVCALSAQCGAPGSISAGLRLLMVAAAAELPDRAAPRTGIEGSRRTLLISAVHCHKSGEGLCILRDTSRV